MAYLDKLPLNSIVNYDFKKALFFIKSIKTLLDGVDVYSRLQITSSNEVPATIQVNSVEGYMGLTDLHVSSAGTCARVEYNNSGCDMSVSMCYNKENKLISAYACDRNGETCFNIFVHKNTITLLNVDLPIDELEEIIFQNNLVQNEYSLEFLKEFV